MSTLNPVGVKIDARGREYELLFTLNVIDKLQDMTGKLLPEIMLQVANVKDPENIPTLKLVLSTLMNDYAERMNDPFYSSEKHPEIVPVTEKQVGYFVDETNWGAMIDAILTAYGFSMPESDDDDEDPDPNAVSGNS